MMYNFPTRIEKSSVLNVAPNMEKSSHENVSFSSSLHESAEATEELERQFMETISQSQRLQNKVSKKFADYEKKLKLEQMKRRCLESNLKVKQENCQNREKEIHELTTQVSQLTKLNESLSNENCDLKNELQQLKEQKTNLLDELTSKDIRLKDLEKDCQKLLKEKETFNKNLHDRLRDFINDISVSDNNNLEMTSEVEEAKVQMLNKRPAEIDISMIHEENPASKRQKTTSSDPTLNPLNDQNDEHEPLEESRRHLDSQMTQTIDGPMIVKAETMNEAELMEPSREVKPEPDPINIVDVVESVPEIENPILEKRRNFRKNIKKVMDFDKLSPETKLAYHKEKERKQQYMKRLQKYNEEYGTLPGEPNKSDKLVLDFDLNTKRELLVVDERLSLKLKPHQFQGIKFMWDVCFESIEKLQSSEGSGCILGHCMGLGKTLQVITLVHCLLSKLNRIRTKVSKVLILCPVNVILNWVDEFKVWLKDFRTTESVQVYELASCNASERIKRVKTWHKNGGVAIIGYNMFQKMHQDIQLNHPHRDIMQEALINPGANLVVCDEGHLLKNPASKLSLAINSVRTLRRIVLTGTPLQNNLKEYFSMVEFVKPRILGTETEFNNRFVGPILNGQFIDSTDEDIMLMKYRACILHKLLDGCVQRRDYSVLAEFLPPKQEYVLFIRLTKVQIDLYKLYMTKAVRTNPIADLPSLRKICNHPKVLADFEDRRKRNEQSKARKRVVPSQKNDAETAVDSSNLLASDDESEVAENADENEWWKAIYSGGKLELSGKMLILFSILADCEAHDEKLLVFSGCLSTLNVIEHFLAKITEKMGNENASASKYKGTWIRNVDYLRLDGTKNVEQRKIDVATFNKDTNRRARLFLISTKAGGLGINLMAANRVVIFDASWNPSDDIQSIFRTYRIGQNKECYVYRFVALGTMEEKIYDRQVSKLSIAKRVIDEHQINRHYKEEDLQQLYCVKNLDPPNVNHLKPSVTKDRLLNALLKNHRHTIAKYHDHDSLLENMIEETLTDQEIGDVWEEFETSENVDVDE